MANKYLDYPGLQRLVENINKKYAPIQAIVFQSTVEDIAALPALSTVKAGYMYNIKTGGITTEDFVEGAGHIVTDGENIAAVELITGYAPVSPAADADPRALGYFEVDTVNYNDVTASLASDADPSELGLYEEDGAGGYQLTADTEVQVGKSYFEKVTTYKLTEDRLPVAGHNYFESTKVMKWDLMGGVFDLEGKYLEFGKDFPQKPESRMVDGRTFLFMGEDRKIYTFVESPTGRPVDEGYFEGEFTQVTDTSTIVNPKQVPLYEQTEVEHYSAVTPEDGDVPSDKGWYERTGSGTEVDPYAYTPSTDSAVDPDKTYYQKDASTFIYARTTDATVVTGKTYYTGTFTASTDTTVNPAKQYYTESVLYKKGGIYEYDATAKEWELQSSGGAEVESIPLKDIDDLFI